MGEGSNEPFGDWAPDDFEAHGRELLDLLREYFAGLDGMPAVSHVSAAELNAALDGPPPEEPEPFERLLDDTRRLVLPNLAHWNHPRFHAYFAISGSGAGILAETATAALNVNAMLWRTGPAASALERVVLRWLAGFVGYPGDADGVLVNGASLASFYALVAALHAAGLGVREQGLAGRDLPRLRLYVSDQTHSSLEKAAIAGGLGLENVVKVPSDDGYRMDPAKLDDAIRRDVAAGHRPVMVCATVGTTATGAVDPVEPIGAVAHEHGAWLHIDAAYGGFWSLVPDVAPMSGDLSVGDSLLVNPHKTLYVPLEATAFFCRRRGVLRDAFSVVPEYLRSEPDPEATNFMDYSLQLGRSFRALKIWWVVRTFGLSGIRRRMVEHVRLARLLESWAEADPDWRLPARSPYPLVCLRAEPAGVAPGDLDALNQRVLERVNHAGAFVSHAVLREGYTIRVSIGNIRTAERHVEQLWRDLREALRAEVTNLRTGQSAC